MPRAIWTGTISFGLVNVPVRMYSAIDEHDLRFHLVHEPDNGRIGYQKICKAEDAPVRDDELVKAFEVEKDELVVLTEGDFAAVKPEGVKWMEISDFVPYEGRPRTARREGREGRARAGGDADPAVLRHVRPGEVRGHLPRGPLQDHQGEAEG